VRPGHGDFLCLTCLDFALSSVHIWISRLPPRFFPLPAYPQHTTTPAAGLCPSSTSRLSPPAPQTQPRLADGLSLRTIEKESVRDRVEKLPTADHQNPSHPVFHRCLCEQLRGQDGCLPVAACLDGSASVKSERGKTSRPTPDRAAWTKWTQRLFCAARWSCGSRPATKSSSDCLHPQTLQVGVHQSSRMQNHGD